MTDRLGDMELFVRIVRAGALGRGGRQLGLSPATTTARLQRLEAFYGVRLLHRTTRQIRPTEEGLAFFDACLRVLAEVEGARRSVTQSAELSGPLRITAPRDLGQQHIAPLLTSLQTTHPEVIPYLHLHDGLVDLIQEGMDLGVRYGALHDSGLVSRKLADNERILVASNNYLERAGIPTTAAELQTHTLITMVPSSHSLATWVLQGPDGRNVLRCSGGPTTNDGVLARIWASEGQGITVKSIWDVRQDLILGRLRRVMPHHTVDFEERSTKEPHLHLVYASKRYLPSRVRMMIELVADHFQALNPP